MRGDERVQDGMFSYVTLEQRVPREHPLREIRKLTDEVLRSLSAEFDGLYSDLGRRSIAPEYVLAAGVLLGAVGAATGRADRLQPAVSLVRGHGRFGMGTMPCSRRTATVCSRRR